MSSRVPARSVQSAPASSAPAHEALILRVGSAAAGGVFLAAAALAAAQARDHMALLGTLCGAGHDPHCGWCYGAAGLVSAGLAACYRAVRTDAPDPVRVRA